MFGGWQDKVVTVEDHVLPLYRSLQKQGAESTEIYVFDTDHSFENVREALRSKIILWLKK